MKKATSIFFVLLANIIILAHPLIPHHHKGLFETFVHVHYLSEDCDDMHPMHGETHSHNPHSGECAIGETIVWTEDFDFSCLPDLFLADIYTTNILFEDNVSQTETHYLAGIYLEDIYRSIGLRAPPVAA